MILGTAILKTAGQIFSKHILCAIGILQQQQNATTAANERDDFNCMPSFHPLIKAVGKTQESWFLEPMSQEKQAVNIES